MQKEFPQKKLALTYKLHAEKIDIACLQETHLTSKNRFVIRGYQCFRTDRENRHKGGVTLVKNSIIASEIKIDTGQEAEILGTKFTWDGEEHTLYNYYCPPDKDLSLFHINTTPGKCIVSCRGFQWPLPKLGLQRTQRQRKRDRRLASDHKPPTLKRPRRHSHFLFTQMDDNKYTRSSFYVK